MATSDTVKGFTDFLGEDAKKRKKILEIIETNFKKYGYEPAFTPTIESETFTRGKNSSDSAVRDIFTLKDRGERNLALRFEFTFQLKRIAKKQKLPYKRYQIGSNFRDEPIRKGRTREFTQADVDIIGSTQKDEAENFALIKDIFTELNIPFTIYVNNRKLLNEIMVDENIEEKDRENVIREIDKLDKLTKKEVADNLKQYNAENILTVMSNDESYFEKYANYKEIKELKEYCTLYGVEVVFRPFLARGFSYYNGTVFEVISDNLNVSIMGGGSYLVDNVQATGMGFGVEPIFLLANIKADSTDFCILSLDQDKVAITVAKKLRNENKTVQVLFDKTPSKALEYANTKNIQNIIIIGEKEAKAKEYTIKNLTSGKQTKHSL